MIKVDDVLKGTQKFNIKTLVMGSTGAGKTYFASTFPKSYFLLTEPSGEDTFLTIPDLRKNVVGFDRFIPESIDDTKPMFDRLISACDEAKKMAISGEIDTLVLDNMTYLAETRWIYINKFEQELSPRTGELNTQAMYGKLARWLYNFTLMKLCSFPGNLVITCHEKQESDEAMEKKPDKSSPTVPSILGGFRDDIGGMVSLVLYLGKSRMPDGKYKYSARTNLGMGKNGKSRIPNLPEVVENISYSTLRSSIENSLKQEVK
jgi:hypothetical protein